MIVQYCWLTEKKETNALSSARRMEMEEKEKATQLEELQMEFLKIKREKKNFSRSSNN